MAFRFRPPSNALLFGLVAGWSALLVSCVVTQRSILMPP